MFCSWEHQITEAKAVLTDLKEEKEDFVKAKDSTDCEVKAIERYAIHLESRSGDVIADCIRLPFS